MAGDEYGDAPREVGVDVAVEMDEIGIEAALQA